MVQFVGLPFVLGGLWVTHAQEQAAASIGIDQQGTYANYG